MTSNNRQVEETILSIGRQIYDGIRRKDAGFLSQFLADDFVQRGADGTEATRDEFLRAISEMPVEISSVRGEHERVSVFGEMAIMTGVQVAEWRQSDEEHGVSSVAFVDVFSRRDGRWLLVLAFSAELQG
ncbi:MAG TPA: nuclear transport factor 2 family protein [Pyrinomonadaceae bacterium]|nr:nuclear transport factor 2 family protein [Pyrinomonadaceae bacterium]